MINLEYLNNLNKAQKEAVLYLNGPLLIVAGAGSGKTKVLTSRIAHIILGSGDWFVIEADEYDTAFFDKRAKFLHYRPDVLILGNLEFDHADIFDSIGDIERQFEYLLRSVPSDGVILVNTDHAELNELLARSKCQLVDLMPRSGPFRFSGHYSDIAAISHRK